MIAVYSSFLQRGFDQILHDVCIQELPVVFAIDRAGLVGISQDYYEAAIMDGATKFKRILYIDIPLILPTIIVMFILSIGNIMSIGYEKVYLMQSGTNTAVSEIISTYVYKVGLQNAQFSFATAVGLFNAISKKTADISIF